MRKWRYHSLLVRDLSIADAKLNAEGEKGWELVSMCLIDANTARAFFKMPADEFEGVAAVQADTAFAAHAPFG
jgi:hypothetical protein